MYKITFEVNHGNLNIIQVSKKEKGDWVLIKDKELSEKVEQKFLRTRGSAYYPGSGYGEVTYSENLTYLNGVYDRI